ncbi:Xaa-Pro aminopeptidase [Aliidiomarina minuta]|uniref:Xaa-Pro aminopeptidase n=1 Tax=Aliidiomarina minuta TaxID=880057 RepID=A0A432W4V6_9GAMM|nr:Xaa-Pro aminopeptidase [Aliidiomarina minuta]RUO24437.1 Xaa-Pro aminopeptidase [Aliidiomarina minuta]
MSIPLAELRARREAFKAKMQSDSVAVFAAGHEVTRSNDTEYPFRQDSDFYYLTGINEAEAVLVLIPGQADSDLLFTLPRDAEQEVWHGRRLGVDKAKQLSAVDACYPLPELNEKLLPLLSANSAVYWSATPGDKFKAQQQDWLSQLHNNRKLKAPVTQHDSHSIVHEQRLFKSTYEQQVMRESAAIAVVAHKRAMHYTAAGKYEYQVAAELHHEFALHGALHPAYGTICGSGDNACILHYTSNLSRLQDGDLLLIDAGCEYQGYASDITRTFPVNGRFTEAQKRMYNWVLKAQRAALEEIKPGATLPGAYKVAASILTEGLIDLGVLKGSLADNLKDMTYRPYFMHGLGHWLGLDVHDVGNYQQDGKPRPLQEGMVLTIEPGLYIPTDTPCAEEYRGVGIRIEDDILVTADGYQNLTAALPVTTDDIEALMAGKA